MGDGLGCCIAVLQRTPIHLIYGSGMRAAPIAKHGNRFLLAFPQLDYKSGGKREVIGKIPGLSGFCRKVVQLHRA
jgi:hypothetical protein